MLSAAAGKMWSRWTGLALWTAAAVASPAPECAWCEAGNDACNHSYAAYELDLVETSISGAVGGRRFPLWRPAYQPPFGAPSPATLAVVVHHGALRNGDAYCAHVANAVLATGRDPASVLVVCPQIYEAGDAGLDEATMLWWGASADDGVEPDRGERDWHWGGNSTAELGASLSTFSVLDELVAKDEKGRKVILLYNSMQRDQLQVTATRKIITQLEGMQNEGAALLQASPRGAG